MIMMIFLMISNDFSQYGISNIDFHRLLLWCIIIDYFQPECDVLTRRLSYM